MIIFPAIDIKGGKCVRLLKGDFEIITHYDKSPIDQAKEFCSLGFNNVHLVDLDGALGKISNNANIIKEIAKINKIKIQTGGGIRTLEHIKKLIDLGVDKVIIGTAAINNIDFQSFKEKSSSVKVSNEYKNNPQKKTMLYKILPPPQRMPKPQKS